MPKQYTPEVKDRAVTYVQDCLDRYKSVYGACQDLAPKQSIGAETLRRWVAQAQDDAGDRTGPTSEELAQINALNAKIKELEETNEILRQSAIFFS
ncbi:transposase [Glutamicibacter mishrai]|uniref:transposase n=1 Tax=Glutamicibacter mishrai TaxID=1775880 RepID=UPI003F7A2AD4